MNTYVASNVGTAPGTSRRDAGYEWKAVALLCLGFGLVGLQRR